MIDRPPSLQYLRTHAATLLPYFIAACVYIAIGVWEPRFLLSWAEGILFLLAMLWAIPAIVRRIRRR